MTNKKLEKDNKKPIVGFGVIVREFKKDKVAMSAFVIFVALMLIIVIGALIIPNDVVTKVNPAHRYRPPMTRGFILGANEGGQEILYLLIKGAANSLAIAFSVTIITTIVGIFVGTVSGYYGGLVDMLIMRTVDFWSILPTLLMIIAFLQVVPKYDVLTFVLIMSLFQWTGKTRLFRGKALSESSLEYIKAAKTLGASDSRIMLKELLPNMSSTIIVNLILTLAGNIGLETGLTYLGFGLPLGTPSLGTLIGYAKNSDIIKNKMWVWVPAALLVLILMLCINYMGQALQRASDSKQRRG